MENALHEYFPRANARADIGKFANKGLQVRFGYAWLAKPMVEKLRSVV